MKKIIFIVIIILAIGGFAVYTQFNANNKTTLNTKNPANQPTTIQPGTGSEPDFKIVGDDKDSVIESNNLLLNKVAELTKQVVELQNNTNEHPASLVTPSHDNIQKNLADIGNKSVNTVKSLVANVNKTINNQDTKLQYPILSTPNNHNTTDLSAVNASYHWESSLLSSTQTAIVQHNESIKDIFNNTTELKESIPRITIPANSIVKTINTTALLGRIPISGSVQDPYRFTLKVSDLVLYANNHKNDNLNSVLLSGTASGDAMLSCVRATIDSITYIFADGTISQNDGVDLATITDKFGFPCIKGKLVTNAPKVIATSSLLSGLASAATAIAESQKTTTTNTDGQTQSNITGDTGKYTLYQSLAGATKDTQKWVNDRAKSYLDVIVAQAGQEIELFFNKQVEIDYDPNGRKLFYKTKGSDDEHTNFD